MSSGGGKRNNCKLTAEQVREIRRRYQQEPITARVLAKAYGMSQSSIYRILHYIDWSTV